jgi:UDP-N-acetylglucosamine transferase subunit ALG13
MDHNGAPRVIVSVGTDKHPFDRLIGWVENWVADRVDIEVFIQYGTSIAPTLTPGAAHIDHDELVNMIRSADVVITHGGPSTVMDVRSNGRLPIVVARDPALGEHVDDHQMRFAEHLGKHGMALLASSRADLHELIDRGLADPAHYRLALDGDVVPPGIVAFSEHMNVLLDINPEEPE